MKLSGAEVLKEAIELVNECEDVAEDALEFRAAAMFAELRVRMQVLLEEDSDLDPPLL